MIGKITAKSILSGFDYAKADRQTVESTWNDVMYYVMPRKRDIQSDKTKGEKDPYDVYDDTAIQSNIILAAGLSGYMTNAAQRWFELRSRNEKIMEEKGVRSYFNECSEIMYSSFSNSNFYEQIHELYLDLGAVGTASIYEEEDEKTDVRFYARHPKEIYIIENDKGDVDIVYRSFKMTAWAAYNFFGKDKCGASVLKAIESNKYTEEFDYVQYICPRHERQAGKKDSLNKPVASYWVSCKDQKISKESGYDEFPYAVTRFYKNSNETYGYSSGIAAYSNIRMINRMMEYYIKGGELSLWPAFLAEHDSMMNTFSMKSGAMNYQRAPLSQGAQIQPIQTNTNYQIGIDFINRVEDKIKSAFFADLFLLLTNSANMTATEVIERTQEKMLLLGPVLGRLQNELLSPIIYRSFNILARRGKLPDPPPALLENPTYDVVYVSPLAKAQRAVQAKDMTTFLTIVSQMAQVIPDVLDNVDGDVVVKKLNKIYSVDPDILREDDLVDAIRQARDKKQQAMEKMAMMQQGAMIADTAGKATKSYADAGQASKQ